MNYLELTTSFSSRNHIPRVAEASMKIKTTPISTVTASVPTLHPRWWEASKASLYAACVCSWANLTIYCADSINLHCGWAGGSDKHASHTTTRLTYKWHWQWQSHQQLTAVKHANRAHPYVEQSSPCWLGLAVQPACISCGHWEGGGFPQHRDTSTK